jgi:hypothetical protein
MRRKTVDLRGEVIRLTKASDVSFVIEGLRVYAAMVGTDFVAGVSGVGPKRAIRRVADLWREWDDGGGGTPFLAFCASQCGILSDRLYKLSNVFSLGASEDDDCVVVNDQSVVDLT